MEGKTDPKFVYLDNCFHTFSSLFLPDYEITGTMSEEIWNK